MDKKNSEERTQNVYSFLLYSSLLVSPRIIRLMVQSEVGKEGDGDDEAGTL